MVDAIYLRRATIGWMGKRGPKPKGKVKIKWSPDFAYAIGLLASDGSLSPDGRHIFFSSIDVEQLQNFSKALAITVPLGKGKGRNGVERITRIQFGDVLFYGFLLSIGFMPNKSRVIGKVKVPTELFFDFLRGSFDGDGCTYSYFDKRWKSSYMIYTAFSSASRKHVHWLQEQIAEFLNIRGHISVDNRRVLYQLRYAKKDSLKLLRAMYYSKNVTCLSRKRLKVDRMLAIVDEHLG